MYSFPSLTNTDETEKFKLLSAMAFLCETVGFHVGMFAPTNAAADHFREVNHYGHIPVQEKMK